MVFGDTVVLNHANTEAATQQPALTIQLRPEREAAPLIAQMLPPQLTHVEEMPVPPSDCPQGTMTFEYSHERITEAFDRCHILPMHAATCS